MAKANTLTDRTITIAQAIPLIEILIHAQRPVFLWASPGIGKSDVVHQLAKSFKPTVEEAKAGMLPGIAVDMRLGQMMPTDVMGIPFFNKNGNGGSGSMDWATPSILPSASLAAKHKIVILFLDELNTAAAAVQAAAYQLVLDRKTGSGYKLPANVAIVAAGNRESDRGVTTRMPTPLSNRFVHLKLRSNFDSWMDWAIDHDIHPDIVGYLNFSPQSLDMFNPTDPAHAFATPRTWAFVNDIMRSGEIAEVMLSELVAGTVGEGTAVGFMAHR